MGLGLRGRVLLMSLGALAFHAVLAAPAPANPSGERQHALSLIGKPQYPADFKAFDWVNPDAPRGGTVRQWAMGTFDSLNPLSIKGRPASGVGLIYDTLMSTSPDEPSAEYCLVCEWVSYPADYGSVTFGLRKEARFHDGRPITADDVIFTLKELTKEVDGQKANPFYAAYYGNVVEARRDGDHQVTFVFNQKGNRELPQILGQLPVLPRHFWQARAADGASRDLSRSTLEVPLGSGPYRIKSVDAGRRIVFERVKDWWAKDLPVSRGQWNFDELRFEYFRDRVPAFEAFKAGDIDYWRESSAKAWATAFDFDAVRQGLVKLERIETKNVRSMQAFVFNIRRKQFQDPRVRRAFNLAFDFESANKNLFFDQYARVSSFFGGTEMAATGVPGGLELEILKSVEADVPKEVFTTEWTNPVNGDPRTLRRNLAEASRLLAEAGWVAKGGVLTNAAGEPFRTEFLLVSPDFERIVLPYKENLEKLGIQVTVRIVDTAQYQRRTDTFDFDIITDSFPQSFSPGNEQRDFWSSAAADREGSRNSIGIKSKAVDTLVERIIFAKDRDELVAATRALDRVLLWSHYVVPQWDAPYERIAMWDRYARPAKLPSQAVSFTRVWWQDPEKAKALAARGK